MSADKRHPILKRLLGAYEAAKLSLSFTDSQRMTD